MTEKLHDELVRIGDAAPRAAVPGDVWARGRRARRRDRVVAGGAVLSVLLVLGGLGWLIGVPGKADVPPASSRGAAVPSVIHPVPERLGTYDGGGRDESWHDEVAETDLGVGRASVAFGSGLTGQTLPVVITAADGRYHLLRLAGWIGNSLASYQSEASPLALSPDGRQLAWGWYDRSTFDDGAVSAGVRVVDLETGKIRTVRLSGARGVAVASVRWSPDSRWLVWQGMELKRWDQNHTSWKRNVAGRIGPDAATSDPIGVSRGGGEELAIDDDGTVAWVSDGGWQVVDHSGLVRMTTDVMVGVDGHAAAFDPSGRAVALATTQPTNAALVFRSVTAAGEGRTEEIGGRISRDLPDDRFPAAIDPVGWIDDDHVVELVTPVHPLNESSWTTGDSELAVMSLRDGDQPAYDGVGHVAQGDEHDGRIQEVTVAVDLMSLDHPTRDFPAPEWPWSDERKVAVFGGIGVALLAAVVFGVAYRRGRRLG